LLAYIIAQNNEGKDETLRDLVCIMAKAPIITQRQLLIDTDAVADTRRVLGPTSAGEAAQAK
jgi:hypothetical protein